MKKIWMRIFSICLICCMAFVCVGCMGSTPEDYEDSDTDFEDTKTLDMYGIKVLYRPDSYDFNTGSGGTAEEENIYYGQYAYYIMTTLYNIYALPIYNEDEGTINNDLIKYAQQFTTNDKEEFLPYLYDSVRYKVDTLGTVNNIEVKEGQDVITIKYLEDGSFEIYKNSTKLENTSEEYSTYTTKYNLNTFENYYLVGANYQNGWNWSFDYDLPPTGYEQEEQTTSLDAYLNFRSGDNYYDKPIIDNNHLYNTFIYIDDTPSFNVENYYSLYFDTTIYQQNFLTSATGASLEKNYDAYSEFTKALEYAIYCYALDLEPNQITVSHSPSTVGGTEYFYSMNVSGFVAEGTKSSVDVALEYIQNLFNETGSFVGLTQLQITKIENWILQNIIGPTAYSNDMINIFSNITEVRTYNGTDYEVSYKFDANDASSVEFGRRYQEVVHNIIEGVCSLVSISGEGGDANIDERFLASEIKEYAGNTFIIGDDANFPKYEEGQSEVAILPLEYQSVVLMLNQLQFIENMYIALKYDADLSGTTEGQFGTDYIEIQVDLNYYNHANNVYCTLASEVAKVYDGPYDIEYMPFDGENGAGDGIAPADHVSGVEFSSIGKMWENNYFGDALPVNAFNPNIGNQILMTEDMKATNYDGSILVSRSPIVLVGTTDVRKWYSIVEPTEDDPLVDENHTYISGKLNHEMFAGQDGCDYLEITYKVLKKPGDANKNYKFYTGIAIIDSSDTPIA